MHSDHQELVRILDERCWNGISVFGVLTGLRIESSSILSLRGLSAHRTAYIILARLLFCGQVD